MNKWLKLGTVIITCTIFAFAGSQITKLLTEEENHSAALARSFDDVASITSEADIVVRAHISKGFTLQDFGSATKVRNQIYQIDIQKVYKNDSELVVENQTQLKLGRMVALKPAGVEEFVSIVDEGTDEEIHPGEYLLFLNTVKDAASGETYVTDNSPNHLYKWKGNKTAENIASSKLKSFDEDDLLDVLEK